MTQTTNANLKPSNATGALHLGGQIAALVGGVLMASSHNALIWLGSQLLLALVFWHAFIVLHETGHNTLFRSRRLNKIVGQWAGFLALIPFSAWQRIHARHHRYTGWQDLDATTASVVPRPLKTWERRLIDWAWVSYLPLFSILYRVQNYWNLLRMRHFLTRAEDQKKIALNILVLLTVYGFDILTIGLVPLLKTLGLALLLSLAAQDLFILSQHTHIPQHHSQGQEVTPFSAQEQDQFTRSLRLPRWLSIVLMNNDAHVLHHQHPHIPGYRLNNLPTPQEPAVHWWAWLRAVKRLPGHVFLFSNRQQTGMNL